MAAAIPASTGGVSPGVANGTNDVAKGLPAHAHTQATAGSSFRVEYAAALAAQAKLMPAMPDVEIKFQDLSYVLHLKQKTIEREIQTVPGAFGKLATLPIRVARGIARIGKPDASVKEFKVLDRCSGVLKPGRTTLLLSPPGHGKTSFLRALANRLPLSKLQGAVTYSGYTAEQALQQGIQIKQLVQYVDQLDVHLPLLTVRETFQFAASNSNVDPAIMGHPELVTAAAERVENIIKLLSLSNCSNTIVGNELFRGVSGGEKKRVTIGEAMVTNARALLMDEISTGLDSSVTFDIVSAIKSWAQIMRGTVVIALLQPTPEVFNLFDDVILMREGGIIYHGPRATLPGYLSALGFLAPMPPAGAAAPALTDASATSPASPAPGQQQVDIADWLVELISHPKSTHAKDQERRAEELLRAAGVSDSALDLAGLSSVRLSGLSRTSLASLQDAGSDTSEHAAAFAAIRSIQQDMASRPQPPTDTEALMQAFATSKVHSEMMNAPAAPTMALTSPFAQAQFGRSYPRSASFHFMQLLWRQMALTTRNSIFVTSRVVMCIFMALVLGSAFWRLGFEAGPQKYGLFLFAALHVAFSNMSEVPAAVENKYVCYKHIFSGMYPSLAYVLAVSAVHVPIAAAESLLFSVIMYFMCGLAEEAGRFFVFVFTLFLVDLCMAALLRAFAYVSPDLETAQVAPSPVISIQMLFAGFLITRGKMGWLLFMHYISIFGYALRTLAQNEFFADQYDVPAPGGGTVGEAYLNFFDFQTDPGWKWGGIGFLAFMYIAVTLIGGVLMGYIRIERNIGTSRSKEQDAVAEGEMEEREEAPASPPASAPVSPITPTPPSSPNGNPTLGRDMSAFSVSKTTTAASALPFEPMTFTFDNIRYRVPVVEIDSSDPSGKRKIRREKVLLQGVSGYAKPGTLTALMGASGAGKTTLLDVIAGRKNMGTMEGNITLNGFPKEHRSFSRLTAYVEQSDIHNAFSTVREALDFSAALRLPPSVTAAQRRAFVKETLDVLELRDIADRKIGESGSADGLSPGQRKRLTIGVEVVSNAPIIFLDEPTTALDSRNAQVVVRVIRNLASRGRTVITTIHQPSAELFYMMDNLLLLQRGGWQVYFGPLGHHKANQLRHYLEAIPGTPACPRKMNPASWMLDVLAGTDSSGDARDGEEMMEVSVVDAAAAGSTTAVAPEPSSTAVVVRQPSAKAAAQGPSDKHPGRVDYQSLLQASPHWAAEMDTMKRLAVPKQGTQPVRFDSVFARNFWDQLGHLLLRAFRSHNRNVDYNFVRIMTLIGLMVLFGTVYYKLDANDVGGIQSIASVQFMTTSFIGMLNMNTAMSVLLKDRAVYYRERASYLYGPEVYAIVTFIAELPWLVLIIFTSVPVVYYMTGFTDTAPAFFFYCLTAFIFTVVFVSIAQFVAALLPNIAVAQAIVGALIPLFFLFGGLFLREPDIPIGWKWMNILDPIRYAFSALIAPQFYCEGAGCPMITVPGTATPIDRFKYVESSFGVAYADRWKNLGFLVCFVAAFQIFHFLSVRFVNHLKR